TFPARAIGTKSLQPPRSQRAAGSALPAREDSAMKFLVQVICVSEAVERREQVFEMERENLTMETLGLGLGESKALLRGVQEFVVAEQVAADLERRRSCPDCGQRRRSQGQGSIKQKTAVGRVEVPNPRWHRCSCQSIGPSTFRPVTSWLNAQT